MSAIKHILCPVDFSDASIKVLEKSAGMAAKLGADITLMHVVSIVPASYGVLYGIDFQAIDTLELVNSATKVMQELQSKYIPAGVKCRIVSVVGNVSSEICAEAKKNSIDLVIMSTSGAHGVEEYLIGSNSSKVARSSGSAVMTVRDPERLNKPGKILVPLDMNLGIKEIRHFLESFKIYDHFEAEILVVNDKGYHDPNPKFTKHYMDKQLEAMHHSGVEKVSWKEVRSEDLVETICRYAEENGFGIIMMKSQGRSTFAKYVLGSNTEAVINHSRVPVLTIRTHADHDHERYSMSSVPDLWKP